jgi:hypothetical protein
MLIREKVVLPNSLFPPLRPLGPNSPVNYHSFFPNYGKKRHSVCSKENRMKMSANQEDAFGQRSNHHARS